MSNQRWHFWDALIFSFTASLMLWRDLPAVEAAIVIVVLFGAAIAMLGGGE